jgi:hypothetical protein
MIEFAYEPAFSRESMRQSCTLAFFTVVVGTFLIPCSEPGPVLAGSSSPPIRLTKNVAVPERLTWPVPQRTNNSFLTSGSWIRHFYFSGGSYYEAISITEKLAYRLNLDAAQDFLVLKESNKFYVLASMDKVRQAREIVNKLLDDAPPASEIYGLKLTCPKPTEFTAKLQALLIVRHFLGDDRPVMVGCDEESRNLYISSGRKLFAELRQLLGRLGVTEQSSDGADPG